MPIRLNSGFRVSQAMTLQGSSRDQDFAKRQKLPVTPDISSKLDSQRQSLSRPQNTNHECGTTSQVEGSRRRAEPGHPVNVQDHVVMIRRETLASARHRPAQV